MNIARKSESSNENITSEIDKLLPPVAETDASKHANVELKLTGSPQQIQRSLKHLTKSKGKTKTLIPLSGPGEVVDPIPEEVENVDTAEESLNKLLPPITKSVKESLPKDGKKTKIQESPIPGYPEDKQATANAVEMVGDGQSPNAFFVSIGDELIDEEPSQASETYSIGQYALESEAEQKFNDVVLDGSKGPRWVSIEDRQSGQLKQRFLVKVDAYKEITR